MSEAKGDFVMHPRLAKGVVDCGRHGICRVLLKDQALFPWIVLVPEVAEDVVELHQLNEDEWSSVCATIRKFSAWMDAQEGVEKVNVAAIGNIVRQLHIHVVGRHAQDVAWPGTVWACEQKQAYEPEALAEMAEQLRQVCG